MSLNGLDVPQVAEAFEAAVAEPGGWLLLNYEGRDEVRVLNRGSGGVDEMRDAIAGYDETSPLYGFLRYRRRSVVIKYLPDDCSRIIQARVAVHLNAICERFSPFDAIFEITAAQELKDTKLSAACSLHTATCSTSSSTSSLRRRRLMEIAEEEDDEHRAAKRLSVQGLDDSALARPEEVPPPAAEQVSLDAGLASSPENSKFSAADTYDVPKFVGVEERPMSPDSDACTISSYPYSKPKVKLGPRPSADTSGRPQTAGNLRPVSAIPAGFKIFGKGGKKSKVNSSTLSTPKEEPLEPSAAEPISDSAWKEQQRPVTSSGVPMDESVVSPAPAPKKATITPEKARLMKAMKLREKKKMMNMLTPSETKQEDVKEAEDTEEESTRVLDQTSTKAESASEQGNQRMSSDVDEEDSGVALDSSTSVVSAEQGLDLTSSDSRPASPLIGSSDAGHSTKASSISESTNETVRAKEEDRRSPSELPEAGTEDVVSQKNSSGVSETVEVVAKEEVPSNAPIADDVAMTDETAADAVEALNSQVDQQASKDQVGSIGEAIDKKASHGPAEAADVAVLSKPSVDAAEVVNVTVEDQSSSATTVQVVEAVAQGEASRSATKVADGADTNHETIAPAKVADVEVKDEAAGNATEIMEAAARNEPFEANVESTDAGFNSQASAIPAEAGDKEHEDEVAPTVGQDLDRTIDNKGTAVTIDPTNVAADQKKLDGAAEATDVGLKDESSAISAEEPLLKNHESTSTLRPNPIQDAAKHSTTIAEVSATTHVLENVGEKGHDDASLGSLSPPISKFSPQALPSPTFDEKADAKSDRGPDSRTAAPLSDAAASATKAVEEPRALNKKVSAQDLLAAAKAASQPTVVPPKPTLGKLSTTTTPDASSVPAPSAETDKTSMPPPPPKIVSPKPLSPTVPLHNANFGQERIDDDEESPNQVTDDAAAAVAARDVASAAGFAAAAAARDAMTSPRSPRTVSNPVRGGSVVPSPDAKPTSPRSISSGAAYLHHITQQQQGGHLAKKSNNMGSSISQRIKALEKLSAASGDQPVPPTRERPSSTFYAVKRREPSRSPSVVERAASLRNSATPSPDFTQENSSDVARRSRLERSGSVSSRLSMFETPTTSAALRNFGASTAISGRGRPESVSVMARIVRDPNQTGHTNYDPSKDPSEYSHLDLKQSTLLIDHQGASYPARSRLSTDKKPGNDGSEPSKTNKSLPSSFSIVKSLTRKPVGSGADRTSYPSSRPQSFHAGTTLASQASISSPRTSFGKDREAVVSPSFESAPAEDHRNSDKKLSRAGRFMRRLSNLSSSRSKTNLNAAPASATEGVAAKEAAQARPLTTGSPPIVSQMGDVNVQFPDNLLWKRRNMCLDTQGFLVLSALQAQNGRPAQGTKRYHLSEFRTPFIPDVEIQELPNSVVLDFIEGSGIQVACEDRAGQMRVLQILQEAHATSSTN